MAQIRIEQRRSGPIWIAAIVALIIVILVVWLYVRHRSAAPAPAPATPGVSAAYRGGGPGRPAAGRPSIASGRDRGAEPEGSAHVHAA